MADPLHPRFRYISVSLFSGDARGTNDQATAENSALCSEDFVIDTETQEWMMEDGTRRPLKDMADKTAYV